MLTNLNDSEVFALHVASQLQGRIFNWDHFFLEESSEPWMDIKNEHLSHDYWRDTLQKSDTFKYIESQLRNSKYRTLRPQEKTTLRNVGDVTTSQNWFNKVASASALHLQCVRAFNARIVLYHHRHYPGHLRYISDCPVALTCWGESERLRDPLVSVVGSRKASTRAIRESFDAGFKLSEVGITVVSGGAFGCDRAAHEGVLHKGLSPCPAIVVFASGLGHLYPKANLDVFDKVRKGGGCLVSERLWQTRPFRSDFPIRNRLIAGMSGLLLLMQAGQASGALITARLSLEYGNDLGVFRQPHDLRAQGSEELVSQGAFAFESIHEVIDIIHGIESIEIIERPPGLKPCLTLNHPEHLDCDSLGER